MSRRLLQLTQRRSMASVSAPTCTYDGWTREQLIERLNILERRNAKPDASSPLHNAKATKPFNFSAHSKRKIALKFCYSGWEYGGLAYQTVPGPLPTVEGVLFDALVKSRLVDPEAGFDGCHWERCGRTDRGVSAGGQVISLWVRSALSAEELGQEVPSQVPTSDISPTKIIPEEKEKAEYEASGLEEMSDGFGFLDISESSINTFISKPRAGTQSLEHDYVQLLNNILPDTIRILAWSPVSDSFSARFSCKSRHYKYFFTPNGLDISRMQEAAKRLIGEHDFRNLCKVDAQKQITIFKRTILDAYVEPLSAEGDVYAFNLIGTAFLYHQVRHIMSILFLIGSGVEHPSLVTRLMNVAEGAETPLKDEEPYEVVDRKPEYQMVDGLPLMLWDAAYSSEDVSWRSSSKGLRSFKDLYTQLQGIHSRALVNAALAKHFFLAASQHHSPPPDVVPIPKEDLTRINDLVGGKGLHVPLGGGTFKRFSKYTPVLERDRLDTVDVINEKWRLGRGKRLDERQKITDQRDEDE